MACPCDRHAQQAPRPGTTWEMPKGRRLGPSGCPYVDSKPKTKGGICVSTVSGAATAPMGAGLQKVGCATCPGAALGHAGAAAPILRPKSLSKVSTPTGATGCLVLGRDPL